MKDFQVAWIFGFATSMLIGSFTTPITSIQEGIVKCSIYVVVSGVVARTIFR